MTEDEEPTRFNEDKLRALRLEPMGGTPADAAKFFASETKLWGRVIKEANITLQ